MPLAGISAFPLFPAGPERKSKPSGRWWDPSQLCSLGKGEMLCLCLYVPNFGGPQAEFEYFESRGLPAELKSIFRLSLLIPSQEFSTYRQWKQVRTRLGCRESGRLVFFSLLRCAIFCQEATLPSLPLPFFAPSPSQAFWIEKRDKFISRSKFCRVG